MGMLNADEEIDGRDANIRTCGGAYALMPS